MNKPVNYVNVIMNYITPEIVDDHIFNKIYLHLNKFHLQLKNLP